MQTESSRRESFAEVTDPANGLWASQADSGWRCKFVWGHRRWRQMNEEIEKSENRRSVYFIFSCRWSWAFNHTLSQGQGNPLATSPACQRTTHKNTFRCKRHGCVGQAVGRSTSLVCAQYVTLEIPLVCPLCRA